MIISPLNSLLKGYETKNGRKHKKTGRNTLKNKPVPWKWTETEQRAFECIKEKLTTPPILGYADYRKPFILHTDASSKGLGAVLYIKIKEVENG